MSFNIHSRYEGIIARDVRGDCLYLNGTSLKYTVTIYRLFVICDFVELYMYVGGFISNYAKMRRNRKFTRGSAPAIIQTDDKFSTINFALSAWSIRSGEKSTRKKDTSRALFAWSCCLR